MVNNIDFIRYYDLDGKWVANSYEEIDEYIDRKYTKPEEPIYVEIPEQEANDDDTINIYLDN